MNKTAEMVGKELVANAFDQAMQFVRDVHRSDNQVFERKRLEVKSRGAHAGDVSEIEIIAAAAAEHALAALFSNIELLPNIKLVLIEDGDTEIDMDVALDAPLLSFFNRDGWLKTYAENGALAAIWQSESEV